jgi:AbrB family looped-hinge helix DNA binding protein
MSQYGKRTFMSLFKSTGTQEPNTGPRLAPLPLQETAKSRHPEYEPVKVFMRRKNHKAAARRWQDEQEQAGGNGDFSDLVDQLVAEYLRGGRDGSITQSVKSRLNGNGRIIIPAPIRQEMGLKAGDAVVMTFEAGVLRIESHMTRVHRIQEEFKQFSKPGILASDELVAERREETRRETEKERG